MGQLIGETRVDEMVVGEMGSDSKVYIVIYKIHNLLSLVYISNSSISTFSNSSLLS